MTSERPRPLPIATRVARVSRLSASLVRVVLHGDALARFGPPTEADAYVKVLFLHPDGDYPRPVDPARIKAEMAPDYWPRLRTYTVRTFDAERRELTLDFVVHGDAGVAGPWAAAAQPGDEVFILGPGGGYSPRPAAAWHLLVGDESALPAIAVALERIPDGADVRALIEVHSAGDEIELVAPEGVAVTWLYRGDGAVGSRLVDAVSQWEPPVGDGQAFVHGEAGMVKEIRRYLRTERGIPLDQLSISGYWRQGADDEKWRAIKREWNRQVDEAERSAVRGSSRLS
jgi:NADPH-dependent ferric siderophore reductase